MNAEPPQLPRFGPIRDVPPDEVVKGLSGAAVDTGWTCERFGSDGDFPNGGIWRVTADRRNGDQTGPVSAWAKRTGPNYLGDSDVWRCRFAADDPNWWGREAAFYESELATSGWTGGVRAASCYVVDDHDECRDLWLEDVHDVPASLDVCRRAAAGLARWQVANLDVAYSWLSDNWIPTHIGRRALDNQRTRSHPAWSTAIERGLDPTLRELVEDRITDPVEIRQQLEGFPRVLTHYDFHTHNIGTVGAHTVVFDWAFVGWGPIGHDVGHLALDEAGRAGSPSEVWNQLQAAYCEGLAEAGWTGDLAVVRRSMAVSNALRLGWAIDHFLSLVDTLPDDVFAAAAGRLRFQAELT